MYRRDRPTADGGGGVMLLVKSVFTSQQIPVEADCEVISVEILLQNQQKLLLSSFYRQPDHTTEQMENYSKSIQEVVNRPNQGNHCIISGGDFNLPDMLWNNNTVSRSSNKKAVHNLFLECMAEYSLSQMVLEHTRENSTLDLFITNRPGLIKNVHVIPGLGDHECVVMNCQFQL